MSGSPSYIWQGFEYASSIKCARVLNMLWYGHNNIVCVASAIILDFLPAEFVHPGTPQLNIL